MPQSCYGTKPPCPGLRLARYKVSRSNRDRVRGAFTSMVSNDLKGITGRWLDEDVAVLAEIALNVRDILSSKCAGRGNLGLGAAELYAARPGSAEFAKEIHRAARSQFKQAVKGQSGVLDAQFCL
jgi:hypothetical protein